MILQALYNYYQILLTPKARLLRLGTAMHPSAMRSTCRFKAICWTSSRCMSLSSKARRRLIGPAA